MAEPNAQRLRVTFTVKRADNDRSYNPHQYGLYTQLNSWVVVRTR